MGNSLLQWARKTSASVSQKLFLCFAQKFNSFFLQLWYQQALNSNISNNSRYSAISFELSDGNVYLFSMHSLDWSPVVLWSEALILVASFAMGHVTVLIHSSRERLLLIRLSTWQAPDCPWHRHLTTHVTHISYTPHEAGNHCVPLIKLPTAGL